MLAKRSKMVSLAAYMSPSTSYNLPFRPPWEILGVSEMNSEKCRFLVPTVKAPIFLLCLN
jgi:hypothetical protein